MGGIFQRLPDLNNVIAPLGVIPPAIIALGQIELYEDRYKRLLYFPVQFIMGIAIVLSNSKAVVSALISGRNIEFKRTPQIQNYAEGISLAEWEMCFGWIIQPMVSL